MSSANAPSRSRPLLHLALLLLTAASVFFTSAVSQDGTLAEISSMAASFTAALLAILGAHEMGHYVLARIHQVPVTLPYFIPMPLLGVGTLGAVIRLKGDVPTRNALVDIGAAGPLAGVVVAVPVLLYGLALSRIGDAPPVPPAFLGDTSLIGLVRELLRPAAEATGGDPATGLVLVYGDSPLMLLLQRLVLGPLPPGKEVFVHPLVLAGWFGLLVTMLNLLPIGQLDGGHLTHALFGERAVLLGRLVSLGLLGLAVFFTAAWLMWFLITALVVGFRHPEVLRPAEPLSRGRVLVCIVCFIVLALCVVPVPITVVEVP